MNSFRQFVINEDFDQVQELVGKYFKINYSSLDTTDPESDSYSNNELEASGLGRHIYIDYTAKKDTPIVRIDFAADLGIATPLTSKQSGAPTAQTLQPNSLEFAKRLKRLINDLHKAGFMVQIGAADVRRRKIYDTHLKRMGFQPTGVKDIWTPT